MGGVLRGFHVAEEEGAKGGRPRSWSVQATSAAATSAEAPPRAGRVPTLLCTSQGLVMAERSQAVIIIALDTRTPVRPQPRQAAATGGHLAKPLHAALLCPREWVPPPAGTEGHFPMPPGSGFEVRQV